MAANFQTALSVHQLGQLDRAETLYRKILHAHPGHFDALLFLGHLYLQTERTQEAAELLGKAVSINPHHAAAQFSLGMALFKLPRYADSIACFDRAVALKPDYAEAYNNRGSALQNLERHEAAIASFDKAIALNPGDGFACNNRGLSLQKLGRHDAAIASLDKAIQLSPGNGATHNNRGISLLYLGRYEEAIAEFNRAIELIPEYFEAFLNQGIALPGMGRHEEALASFDRAISLKPDNGFAHNSRGTCLGHLGRYDESLASFDRAIRLIPDYFEAYNNRGLALPYLGRHEEALASYRQALKIQPDSATAHYNTGMCLLQRGETGDYIQGWQEFEWRWQTDQYRNARRDFPQPLWQGKESLQGKTVLLHAEQGLGDTIQFCRYAQRVAEQGATVLLEVQPELKSTLARLEGVSRILAKGESLPAFDYHCPLLSLPLAFNTELRTIPSSRRYLSGDAQCISAWQSRLDQATRPKIHQDERPRIGLAWSGNTGFGNDHNRSIPLAAFAPLTSEAARFISLQKEVRAADQPILEARRDIVHFGDELRDFSDTTALVELTDLVISVDTSVAHLAGALGKPVWLLLPFNPDWRWLLARGDSPWYPSAKLFRQPRQGDWGSVIEQVAGEVGAMANQCATDCP